MNFRRISGSCFTVLAIALAAAALAGLAACQSSITDDATVYVQGNNLFTIKSIDEDPEYPYGSLRLLPSYIFGVKLSF